MYILGISALYHDSAACLIEDGEIVAAAQEEIFTRVKHDKRFPQNAIKYCMEAGETTADNLEAVVYYDQPLLTLNRVLSNVAALGQESGELIESAYDNLFSKKM